MRERKIAQVCMVVWDAQKSMEQYWKIWEIGPWGVHYFTPDSIQDFVVRGKKIEEDFENIIGFSKQLY